MFYEYLNDTFGVNEPFFISELQYGEMSKANIRIKIKNLTDSGLLKRYDSGIYFIPKKTIFRSGSQPSLNRVIEKKYLLVQGKRSGYFSGLRFANQMGLTSQVPVVSEVVSNRATNACREVKVASFRIIVRSPRIEVTEENFLQLQLLDLLTDINKYADVDQTTQRKKIVNYMKSCSIKPEDLEKYVRLYPNSIFRNMYEMGIISFVSA